MGINPDAQPFRGVDIRKRCRSSSPCHPLRPDNPSSESLHAHCFPLTPVRHLRRSAVALATLLTVACGGGGSTGSATTETAASASGTFPTGLAVASPGDLQAATVTASAAPANGLRLAIDWGRGLWGALANANRAELARLANAVLPMSRAHATAAMQPELQSLAERIAKVLNGDASVDWADVLDLQGMFAGSGNATCYGPQMLYANHQDGGGTSSGQLPGGDLGLWLEYEGGTQPCVAAQLKQRTRGVKGQTMQGLLMMAAMRRTIHRSSTLSMPAAGASTDLASEFETRLHLIPAFASVVVHAATIALDSGGTYTYRLALGNGASGGNAKLGEIILKHAPGGSTGAYSGVMQVSGFTLGNDSAFGCEDAKDSATGLYQAAQLSTIRYTRDGASVAFGSRSGNYCGHPSSTSAADYGAQIASLTAGAELDPAAKLSGNIRGSSTGWRGNFSRFAGSFDKDSGTGNFLYAWQAGVQDGATRALAINADYNSATETRTLEGYFGFGADIASTDGALQGMICNWAGPGNSHTPRLSFQSQVATLTPSATNFSIASGGSRIGYAPTNSCASTTTTFDIDVNATLAAGEGLGRPSTLDAPSGSNTVQQEIEARGFVIPSLF